MHIIDLSHALDVQVPACPGHPIFACTSVETLAPDGSGSAVSALHLGSHTGTHIDAPSHFLHKAKSIDELDLSMLVGPAVVVDVSHKQARQSIDVSDLAGVLSSLHAPLESESTPPRILLIHTGWSRHWPDYATYSTHPHLSPAAAEAIVRAGIRVVGVDTFSPDPMGPIAPIVTPYSIDSTSVVEPESEPEPEPHTTPDPHPVHHILLGAGCVIAENLTNLDQLLRADHDSDSNDHVNSELPKPNASKWMVSLAPLKIAGCDGAPIRAFAWRA
jgi:kynurenine formamidase